jgi:hypothetical protein
VPTGRVRRLILFLILDVTAAEPVISVTLSFGGSFSCVLPRSRCAVESAVCEPSGSCRHGHKRPYYKIRLRRLRGTAAEAGVNKEANAEMDREYIAPRDSDAEWADAICSGRRWWLLLLLFPIPFGPWRSRPSTS